MNGETIRIAVLSDTHGWLRRSVVREVQGCDCILHAGDIIRESDLDELALYGSIYAVRGNNDIWAPGVNKLEGLLRFRIGGVSFCMVHDRREVPRDLNGVDAVIYGHSHRWNEERIDGRLWLNPGSCGRARFGGEVTMARLTLRGGRIACVERVDLEDGDA